MLIAESGSTKTEWRLLENQDISLEFRSPGINPNVLQPEAIEDIFRKAFGGHLSTLDLGQLYFYGAGIGGDSQKGIIRGILQKILAGTGTEIFVEHDILAAARSTRREEGIVCILGTGSNSCHHKDHGIVEIVGGHGYLFGDEGSGMDLGRHLIKGLLEKEFPEEAKQLVINRKGKDPYEIKITIHHSSKPNVRMAELAELVGELVHIPEIYQMVVQRFDAFLRSTVLKYHRPDLKVDFVGSIAFYFQPMVEEACDNLNIKLGTIVKDPVYNLIEFHKSHALMS